MRLLPPALCNTAAYTVIGGGALIRFLSGEELPVVKALRTSAAHWAERE